jgi:hypothetical protein
MYYILEDGVPTRTTYAAQSEWLARNPDGFVVEKTNLLRCKISTIMRLILTGSDLAPFETAVFGGPLDGIVYTARTIENAKARHRSLTAVLADDAIAGALADSEVIRRMRTRALHEAG